MATKTIDVNFESLNEGFAFYYDLSMGVLVRVDRQEWASLQRPDYITVTLEGHDFEYPDD